MRRRTFGMLNYLDYNVCKMLKRPFASIFYTDYNPLHSYRCSKYKTKESRYLAQLCCV